MVKLVLLFLALSGKIDVSISHCIEVNQVSGDIARASDDQYVYELQFHAIWLIEGLKGR